MILLRMWTTDSRDQFSLGSVKSEGQCPVSQTLRHAADDLVTAKLTKIVRSRNNIDCAFGLSCREMFRLSSLFHNCDPQKLVRRVCFVIESAKRRADGQFAEEIRSSSDHGRMTN
jgi:hypothetical protein